LPILRDFERRLEGLVEGLFAATFRGGIQPVELAKRIMREMDAGKTIGVNDVLAPNHFVLRLSQPDFDRFEQAEGALARELERVVREHRPRLVAVVGLTAYRTAFGRPAAVMGLQPDRLGGRPVWVLPNPSGLNAHYKPADFARLYAEARAYADGLRTARP
jgi:hypothetical protein